jgi:endonuclease VIII
LRDGEFGADAWQRVRRSRRTVAELLMDQSIIAGIGNVYRSEVLFRNRISPFVTGEKVKRMSWTAIWQDLTELMPMGVSAGQIITLATQVDAARAELAAGLEVTPLGREHYVYKRAGEPCRVCGHRIRTRVVAGRNLFWCGTCQRRH